MHTVVSIEKSKDIKTFNRIFSNDTDVSETFAKINARNIKHPDKTVSSTSKTLTSTNMKWNQRSQISSHQFSQDELEYIEDFKNIKDVIDVNKDAIESKNIQSQ